MTDTVLVRKGSYRNAEIENTVFDLVKPLAEGAKGLFITVDGTGHAGLPNRAIRIKVDSDTDVELNGTVDVEEITVRSDDDIMDEMREKFRVLDDMTYAALDGVVRGMIVSGPPGIGKSFGVEKIIDEADELKSIGRLPSDAEFGVEKGAATPIGLFMLLYQYSARGSLLVLDDSDSILYDELSLNMLKAALDSGKKRRLNWRSESRALEREGVPSSFEFRGSIIFITNLDFTQTRGKIGNHLEALMSRCHYLDMGIHDSHEKFLRCKQIVQDGMLASYEFDDKAEEEILHFIWEHQKKLRELSLRMVTKIADLRKMNAGKWRVYAENTCLR